MLDNEPVDGCSLDNNACNSEIQCASRRHDESAEDDNNVNSDESIGIERDFNLVGNVNGMVKK